MEWDEFYLLEPFGEEWRQTSMLGALIASNSWFNGKVKFDRFLPVKPPQSQEEIAATVKSFMDHLRACNG